MDFTTGQDASVDDGQKGSRVPSSDNFEVTPRETILCGYDANHVKHPRVTGCSSNSAKDAHLLQDSKGGTIEKSFKMADFLGKAKK